MAPKAKRAAAPAIQHVDHIDLDSHAGNARLGLPFQLSAEELRSIESHRDKSFPALTNMGAPVDLDEVAVDELSAPQFYTTYDEVNASQGEVMKNKLRKYGLCVVQDVIPTNEIDRLRNETWEMVAKMMSDIKYTDEQGNVSNVPAFNINNPNTWKEYNRMGNSHGYLIKHYGIGQSDVSWQLRKHARVRQLYEFLYNTNDLIVSMDSMGIRPGPPREKTDKGHDATQGEFQNTSWLHTDQGPNRPLSTVQSFVSLYDSLPGDPTLHAWPGTQFDELHKEFWDDFTWTKEDKAKDFRLVEEQHLLNPFEESTENKYSLDIISEQKDPNTKKSIRDNYVKRKKQYAGHPKDEWQLFNPHTWVDPRDGDVQLMGSDENKAVLINQFEWLLSKGFRPYAFGHRKGSVVMWDSRVFHEGGLPNNENRLSKRIVSYVCYLPLSMHINGRQIKTPEEQFEILKRRKDWYENGCADPQGPDAKNWTGFTKNNTRDVSRKGVTTSHHPYDCTKPNPIRPAGNGFPNETTTYIKALPLRKNGDELEKNWFTVGMIILKLSKTKSAEVGQGRQRKKEKRVRREEAQEGLAIQSVQSVHEVRESDGRKQLLLPNYCYKSFFVSTGSAPDFASMSDKKTD